MANNINPTAVIVKMAVASVLQPTTKVRTAIAILVAVIFTVGRGLLAKDWAIDCVNA